MARRAWPCAAGGSTVLLQSQLDANLVLLLRALGCAANNEHPRRVDICPKQEHILYGARTMLAEDLQVGVRDLNLLQQSGLELRVGRPEVGRRGVFFLGALDRLRCVG